MVRQYIIGVPGKHVGLGKDDSLLSSGRMRPNLPFSELG